MTRAEFVALGWAIVGAPKSNPRKVRDLSTYVWDFEIWFMDRFEAIHFWEQHAMHYTIIHDGQEKVSCGSLHSLAEWVQYFGGMDAITIEPALPIEQTELLSAMVEARQIKAA